MSATFNLTLSGRVTLGGESERFDLARQIALISQQLGAGIIEVPALAAGQQTTLWQSSQHATSVTELPEQFSFMAVLADPDSELASVDNVDVELGITRNRAVTVDTVVHRINRNTPLLVGSSRCVIAAADAGNVALDNIAIVGAGSPGQITRIRARATSAAAQYKIAVRAYVLTVFPLTATT